MEHRCQHRCQHRCRGRRRATSPLWRRCKSPVRLRPMPDGPSTSEIFEQAIAGDEEAWKTLVDRLSPAIWGAVRSIGLNRAQSEDVFGIVWLRLLDKHDNIRDPERLAGWLYTTARNEALAIVRANNRLSGTELIDLPDIDDRGPGAAVEKASMTELMWAGLNELDERCRRLLRLVTAVPKVPYSVIADHLDMKVGSIGPTRERCLQKLRATTPVQALLETTR